MTQPIAFRATYSDFKLIRTRQCVQIVFELPLSDFDTAYQILGGMPNPAKETWFGIAPLAYPPSMQSQTKRSWDDIPPAQQAGIRCDEPSFSAFLREQYSDHWDEASDAVECIYLICEITSRSSLNTNPEAAMLWHQIDQSYQAWKAL